MRISAVVFFVMFATSVLNAASRVGTVLSETIISDTAGNFTGGIGDQELFGTSVDSLGDLDGDSIFDLVVGTSANVIPTDTGKLWILFLNNDNTVKAYQKIDGSNGFFGVGLSAGDAFGQDTANLGDLDGDGVIDLAVGAFHDDSAGADAGAVWILFMNSDGTVKSKQKITEGVGNFSGNLDAGDGFGTNLSNIGDLDGDGVVDLAVGAYLDDDGGADTGAVWILFLNANGTVKAQQKISDTVGNFTGIIDSGDYFGGGVAGIGDLNGDGVNDLAVGAYFDDDGGSARGAVWILFLNTNGTVASHQKISSTTGGFSGPSSAFSFGFSVEGLGDIDRDGHPDLAVGSHRDTGNGGDQRGAVYLLFLNPNGTVREDSKIGDNAGGLTSVLEDTDKFGTGIGYYPNPLIQLPNYEPGLPGTERFFLAIGAHGDSDGGAPGSNRGAVYILLIQTPLVLTGVRNNWQFLE